MSKSSNKPVESKSDLIFREYRDKVSISSEAKKLYAGRSMTVINMMMGTGIHSIDSSK